MNHQLVDRPRPGAGEVLINVAAVGICGSEIEGYLGRMGNRKPPLIMGHEASGVIAAVGHGADGSLLGQRVYMNPVIQCGRCDVCLRGTVNLCASKSLVGISRPGAFAEAVVIPARNAIPIPDKLTHEAAAVAEPLANVLHAFDMALRDGYAERVLVIGAGAIGLLAVQVARRLGAHHVTLSDIKAKRLAVGEQLGADRTVAPLAITEAASSLPCQGFDLVVDAVGAGSTRELALSAARSGGQVILLGLHEDRTELPFHLAIRREIRLIPSFLYLPHDTERALTWLELNWIEHSSWVTGLPMRDGPAVFAQFAEGMSPFTKVLLAPDAV